MTLYWMRPVLARVKIFCVMCMLLDESTTKCTGYKVWKEDDFKAPRCNSPVGSVGSIFIGALHCLIKHQKDGMPILTSREL